MEKITQKEAQALFIQSLINNKWLSNISELIQYNESITVKNWWYQFSYYNDKYEFCGNINISNREISNLYMSEIADYPLNWEL